MIGPENHQSNPWRGGQPVIGRDQNSKPSPFLGVKKAGRWLMRHLPSVICRSTSKRSSSDLENLIRALVCACRTPADEEKLGCTPFHSMDWRRPNALGDWAISQVLRN